MNPELCPEAADFGEAAARAFADLGGVELVRLAEADPTVRADRAGAVLDRLGVADIDPTEDAVSAEVAAALCVEAGRVALPYPLVPVLLARAGVPLALTRRRALGGGADDGIPVDHADLFDHWLVASLGPAGGVDGRSALPVDGPIGTRLGPFVGHVAADEPDAVETADVVGHLVLSSFLIEGMLLRAVELAVAHVGDRVQFDKPLSAFQAVQFQLADAHVAAQTVAALNRFALWQWIEGSAGALADALGARSGALDAARTVLRTTQQLHGAAGVCDEYDISVLVRMAQPQLRIPIGADATAAMLADVIDRVGFTGLFDHGAVGLGRDVPEVEAS